MLEAMPCSLFAEWQAYYNVAPWGEERDALHMAIATQWMLACHCTDNYQIPNANVIMPDFLNLKAPSTPQQTEEHMKATWAEACAGFNRKRKG